MRQWIWSGVATLVAVLGISANANAASFVEGTDYAVISPAKPTSNPSKIVVTEFFSYQCPHCYHFSPLLESWVAKLPADVVFERVPVSFGHPDWASVGQAFYALQAMNKLTPKLDDAIFKAIHEQRVKLGDLSSITDWLVKQGIDGKDFADMYNSFGVKMNMNRAEQAAPAYGIDGVPTLIIDGKYRVASRENGSQLETADQLIAIVRASKSHK